MNENGKKSFPHGCQYQVVPIDDSEMQSGRKYANQSGAAIIIVVDHRWFNKCENCDNNMEFIIKRIAEVDVSLFIYPVCCAFCRLN